MSNLAHKYMHFSLSEDRMNHLLYIWLSKPTNVEMWENKEWAVQVSSSLIAGMDQKRLDNSLHPDLFRLVEMTTDKRSSRLLHIHWHFNHQKSMSETGREHQSAGWWPSSCTEYKLFIFIHLTRNVITISPMLNPQNSHSNPVHQETYIQCWHNVF